DREIAGADLGEGAAEAESIDHRDRGFREHRELLPAPLIGGAPRLVAHGRIGFRAAEIEPDILAGRKGFARPGDHQDLGLLIDRKLIEHIVHVQVQLRTHGVALVGPVEDHPGDPLPFLDLDGLIFLCSHLLLLTCLTFEWTDLSRRWEWADAYL